MGGGYGSARVCVCNVQPAGEGGGTGDGGVVTFGGGGVMLAGGRGRLLRREPLACGPAVFDDLWF